MTTEKHLASATLVATLSDAPLLPNIDLRPSPPVLRHIYHEAQPTELKGALILQLRQLPARCLLSRHGSSQKQQLKERRAPRASRPADAYYYRRGRRPSAAMRYEVGFRVDHEEYIAALSLMIMTDACDGGGELMD